MAPPRKRPWQSPPPILEADEDYAALNRDQKCDARVGYARYRLETSASTQAQVARELATRFSVPSRTAERDAKKAMEQVVEPLSLERRQLMRAQLGGVYRRMWREVGEGGVEAAPLKDRVLAVQAIAKYFGLDRLTAEETMTDVEIRRIFTESAIEGVRRLEPEQQDRILEELLRLKSARAVDREVARPERG